LLDRIMAEPDQISPVVAPNENFGLGYRGLIVRQIKTDDGPWSNAKRPSGLKFPTGIAVRRSALPDHFRVGSKTARQASAADWLLQTSERKDSHVTDLLREVVREGVTLLPSDRAAVQPSASDTRVAKGKGGADEQIGVKGAQWWACSSAYYSANAAVFNDPAHVTRNNCYCFASNHLADVRYALPGRRGGHPATSITCGGVIAGLRADGWVDGCQTNTLTIVLVIWPNVDYHFYRVVTGGPAWWWGHKPGGTPAKYTDDSGRAINLQNGLSPSNCNRGKYTDFCGYFYQNNSTAFVA
ncbi:MAG TPA: hypothetical protein VES89_00900, partial [Candidatus Competibacteraceae bacterium]|nr:hypothetical protein [Candidatus Competibacteraceae bacterium]